MTENNLSAILERLRGLVDPKIYDVWCRNLNIVHIEPNEFRVLTVNTFYQNWLQREIGPKLREAIASLGLADPKVEFYVDEGAAPQQSTLPFQPTAPQHSSLASESRVNERKTTAEMPSASPKSGRSELVSVPPVHVGPSVSYAEGNFARLPFALVNDYESETTKEILVVENVRSRQGEVIRKLWRVTAGASGMPGPFEHAIFRALEKYTLDTTIRKGIPLEHGKPVCLHLKTLTDILGVYYNTREATMTSRALDRIQQISIENLGYFSLPRGSVKKASSQVRKGKRKIIHLIDAVKATGDVVGRGQTLAISGTYAVYFGQDYIESVNNGLIRPLDWDLWISFKRPITRRLVEILEPDFYGLLQHPGVPHVAYTIPEISQLIPLKTQRYFSKSRAVLDRAHAEAAAKGFLTWQWDCEGKVPRVLYRPGERWTSFHLSLGHGVEPTDEAKNLANELGESERASFYQQLLDRVPGEYVNEVLKDLQARDLAGTTPDNKAAWFIAGLKAIMIDRGQSLFPLA